MSVRDLLSVGTDDPDCGCTAVFERDRLAVDGDGCPGSGDLAVEPACRATAIRALRERDADAVVVRAAGTERRYGGRGAALLVAAGRFADRIADRDPRLTDRAERDPLAAAREAGGRAGPVADVAAETGLLEAATGLAYDDLRPHVAPAIAHALIAPAPPPSARIEAVRDPAAGPTVRVYREPGRELRRYHLEPVDATLTAADRAVLAAARERFLDADADGDTDLDRAARRAVCGVDAPTPDAPLDRLAGVLRKHAAGYGVLEDVFADDRVTDLFATAPVGERPLRVRVAGETMRTNVRLPTEGAAALASRLRYDAGRAFSRASPTLDAVAEGIGAAGRIRAAGVTDPVSDGNGFAFRAHGRDPFTLPRLVVDSTLTASAAALLSLAVERGIAGLVVGPRGAGKTTLLGALLWELPAATRLVVLEDTPELPVDSLRNRGRDVQALHTELEAGAGLSPAEALRTALRLGDGALVVGEVRGEEAPALYEAMRVGAHGDAVLGTVHGADGAAVRERVIADLGVDPAAFAATDLVVSLAPGDEHAVAAVEEVIGGEGGVRFEALFRRDGGEGGDGLAPTGRLDRGKSRLLPALAAPDESYADVRGALAARESFVADLAGAGRTAPRDVVAAHARRRGGQ
jgi:type IV secretory pathway ATPase VirB11/archaellum biosynthesis ATPase